MANAIKGCPGKEMVKAELNDLKSKLALVPQEPGGEPANVFCQLSRCLWLCYGQKCIMLLDNFSENFELTSRNEKYKPAATIIRMFLTEIILASQILVSKHLR